ncbi:MAG: hypothetical protein N3F66_06935 [Spirochaetes bacterium]|nr:hypothetical protein [Spirochaetota bacterium]
MLNKVSKFLLVSTSFAPVFLTLWFAEFSKSWDIKSGIWFLIIAIVLVFLCLLILTLAKKKLEKLPVVIQSISTSDKEIVGFILVYLLPLINQSAFQIEPKLLYFVLGLFFVSIFTTNSYHFNPILGFLGFHFYEVTIDGGITYVLITKKNLTNTKNIKTVVQIAEYMILEIEDKIR